MAQARALFDLLGASDIFLADNKYRKAHNFFLAVPMVVVKRAKGINDKVVQLLSEEVLYPDQEIVFVGKGQIAKSDATREKGIICARANSMMMTKDMKKKESDMFGSSATHLYASI